MRIALENSADEAFGIEAVATRAGSLRARRLTGSRRISDSQGKPCSGELAELREQVYVKYPVTRSAKLDDGWIDPVTWKYETEATAAA